ncbi:MAG: sigma-70 family RNA polymerase sigma factor [Bacteroidales bacterium]|nr:sigma-70 family RNA polymerase sigma factor [Bacteroidales bacterium]
MTEKAFHRDYLSLAETLYRVAYYLLESEAEAEDAVQELYLKLWDARARLDEVQSPKAYSIRMLKNLCLNRIRQARKLTFPATVPEPEAVPPQDDVLDARRRLDHVLAGIKSLPDRQREILLLRTVEGLSYDEIAHRTGMNPPTLRVLLARARNTLKNCV